MMHVGVVGLGEMGSAIARNLLARGYQVSVWNADFRLRAPCHSKRRRARVKGASYATAWVFQSSSAAKDCKRALLARAIGFPIAGRVHRFDLCGLSSSRRPTQ